MPAAMVTMCYHDGQVTKNLTMELKNEYKIQSSIECPHHNAERPIQIMVLFSIYMATGAGICSQYINSATEWMIWGSNPTRCKGSFSA